MTLALGDFEKAAKRHLPPAFFGYVAGAAEERASLVENRAAFAEPALVPRVLRDVNARSQATTLFGKRYALFVRTKAADQILQSVAEFCMRTSDSYHPHGLRLAGANCGHR